MCLDRWAGSPARGASAFHRDRHEQEGRYGRLGQSGRNGAGAHVSEHLQERGAMRSWKGYDWGILNRMHERGWIGDPVSKNKSVS